jgi:hypothetical protein
MDFHFKNKLSVFLALFLAILQIILLKEIAQMFVTQLFGVGVSSFTFKFPSFSYYFEPFPVRSMPVLLLMYFSPYIYLILTIETASVLLKKIPVGKGRFFIVIFNLIQIGYLLIHIFYSAVILILNPKIENDWITLALYLNFNEIERFGFAFGVIFLFVFYLNMSTKRIMKYINY